MLPRPAGAGQGSAGIGDDASGIGFVPLSRAYAAGNATSSSIILSRSRCENSFSFTRKVDSIFSCDCPRFKTPANPIKASEAQAGHCSAQFPTQWQSSQRYALAKGMYCIERSVIYQPRLSRIGKYWSSMNRSLCRTRCHGAIVRGLAIAKIL
jgi:hypothetical protein